MLVVVLYVQFVGENAVTSLLGLTNGRFLHFGVAIHRKTSYVLCRTDISWGKHFAHYVLMENNPSASAGEIVVSSLPLSNQGVNQGVNQDLALPRTRNLCNFAALALASFGS